MVAKRRRRRTAKRRYSANKAAPKARKTATPAAAKKVTKAVKAAKAVEVKAEKTLEKAEKVLKQAKKVAKAPKAKKPRAYKPRAARHAKAVGGPSFPKRSLASGAFVPWAGRTQKPGRGHRKPGYHAYTGGAKLRDHWRLFENKKRPSRRRRGGKRHNVGMPQRSSRTGRFLKRGYSANKTRKTRRVRRARKSMRRNVRRTAKGRFVKRSYKRNKSRKGTRRSWLSRTFGWKKNQGVGAVVDTVQSLVKPGLAAAAGFFLARIAGNYVRNQVSTRSDVIRTITPPLANLAVALGAWYLPRKVSALSALKVYSEPAAIGAMVGLAETLLVQFGGDAVRAHIAPPALGDSLDVYERALRGMGDGGWNDYNPSDDYLLSTLADDDGVGEYITEPLGEYIQEPLAGLGEYISEPGSDGSELFEASSGIDTGIYGPGVGDLGVEVEEAIAGTPIEAEEGLANHIFGGATSNGLFGMGADTLTPQKVMLKAKAATLANLKAGMPATDAAKHAYSAVKASEGVTTGSAALRAAVVAGVKEALQSCGCCKSTTRAPGLARAGARRPVAPMVTGPRKCREVCSSTPTTKPGLRLVAGAPQLTQSIGAGGVSDDLGDDLTGGGIFGGASMM